MQLKKLRCIWFLKCSYLTGDIIECGCSGLIRLYASSCLPHHCSSICFSFCVRVSSAWLSNKRQNHSISRGSDFRSNFLFINIYMWPMFFSHVSGVRYVADRNDLLSFADIESAKSRLAGIWHFQLLRPVIKYVTIYAYPKEFRNYPRVS